MVKIYVSSMNEENDAVQSVWVDEKLSQHEKRVTPNNTATKLS